MKHRLVALSALVAVTFTGGCGIIDSAVNGASATQQPTTNATTPAAKEPTQEPTPGSDADSADEATSGLGSVKDSGDIPDPCTLFTKAQAESLTGRKVTQIDEDGGSEGDATRFCQWQQESGQLAIFLTRTTPDDFQVTVADAEPVSDLGDDAYSASGHLYVLYGTVQLDVYSRGGSDEQNLADEKKVAKVLIPSLGF